MKTVTASQADSNGNTSLVSSSSPAVPAMISAVDSTTPAGEGKKKPKKKLYITKPKSAWEHREEEEQVALAKTLPS